jgi:hypothetical protein
MMVRIIKTNAREGPLAEIQTWTFDYMYGKEGSVAIFTESDLTSFTPVSEITADVGGIRCLAISMPTPAFPCCRSGTLVE